MQARLLATSTGALSILLAAILLLPGGAAQSGLDETPGNEWIDMEYAISYTNITTIKIDILMRVREIVNPSNGQAATAEDVRNGYKVSKARGQSDADAFIAPYTSRLNSAVGGALANFDAVESSVVDPVAIDETSLEPAAGEKVDAYHPSIRFTTQATLSLDRARLGLGEYDIADLQAVLDAGAIVRSVITLNADPGHSAKYTITPIAGAVRAVGPNHDPADTPPAPGGKMTFRLDNLAGTTAATVETWRELHMPTAERPAAADVPVDVHLGLTNMFNTEGGGMPIDVRLRANVNAIDVADLGTSLPDSVTLPFLSANGLRTLYGAGLVSDADLRNGEADILTRTTSAIGDRLGDSPFTGGFDTASLAKDATGPVTFEATKSGKYADVDAKGATMKAAFRSGAIVNLAYDVSLVEDREQTFHFEVPSSLFFKSTGGGMLSKDGTLVTFVFDNRGNPGRTESISVDMMHKDFVSGVIPDGAVSEVASKTPFTTQVATAALKIDLQDVDITLAGAAGGDFGTMKIVVTFATNINVIEIPASARDSLPASVSLSHLPADGFRLLYESGAITDADIKTADEKLLATIRDQLKGVLGGDVVVTGGFDRATLTGAPADGPLTGDRAILFSATTSFDKSLSGAAPSTEAAMVLKTVTQKFSLPLVDGVDTAYRFLLPPGFSLESVQGDKARTETFQEDGRDGFVAEPEGEGAAVTMSIGVTSSFVLAKFWPWVVLAVIIVFLIVAIPVWAVARRMKGKKA